jgi:serine/threonine protein kinase
MRVIRPLPPAGAEADLYVVDAPGGVRVLRLERGAQSVCPEVAARLDAIEDGLGEGVVRTFGRGTDGGTGRRYEIQEYLPLGDLSGLMARGPLPERDVLALADSLSRTLDLLHSSGIIHRDIKPANILLRSLDPPVPALCDFGISSALAPGVSMKLTRAAFTALYTAPEAVADFAGAAGDFWSLGAVLLEAATGHHPLDGLPLAMVMRELTTRGLAVPDGLPPDVRRILRGLLERDDRARWRRAQVADALRGGSQGIPPAGTTGEPSGHAAGCPPRDGAAGLTRDNATGPSLDAAAGRTRDDATGPSLDAAAGLTRDDASGHSQDGAASPAETADVVEDAVGDRLPSPGAGDGFPGAYGGLKEFRDMRVIRWLPRWRERGWTSVFVVEAAEGERALVLDHPGKGSTLKLEIAARLDSIVNDLGEGVVRTFSRGWDGDGKTARRYEIREYLPLGDLAGLIERGPLSERDILALADSLSRTLALLHSRGIVHGDVCPANILLRSLDPPVPALCGNVIRSALCGRMAPRDIQEISYRAPESFTVNCPKEAQEAKEAGDFWSLGAVLLEAATGRHPLKGHGFPDYQAIHLLQTRGLAVPDRLPPIVQRILRGLLTRDMGRRWGRARVADALAERCPGLQAGHQTGGTITVGARPPSAVPAAAEEGRGADPIVSPAPFHIMGNEFRTPEELALWFGRDGRGWDAGVAAMRWGSVERWLRDIGRGADADGMAGISSSPNERLFWFIRTFAPWSPPTFRGVPLDKGSIAALYRDREKLSGEALVLFDAITSEGSPLRRFPKIARACGLPLCEEVENLLTQPFCSNRARNAHHMMGIDPEAASAAHFNKSCRVTRQANILCGEMRRTGDLEWSREYREESIAKARSAFREAARLHVERRGRHREGYGSRFPVYLLLTYSHYMDAISMEHMFFSIAEKIVSLLLEIPSASGSTPFFSVVCVGIERSLRMPLTELDPELDPGLTPDFMPLNHSGVFSEYLDIALGCVAARAVAEVRRPVLRGRTDASPDFGTREPSGKGPGFQGEPSGVRQMALRTDRSPLAIFWLPNLLNLPDLMPLASAGCDRFLSYPWGAKGAVTGQGSGDFPGRGRLVGKKDWTKDSGEGLRRLIARLLGKIF